MAGHDPTDREMDRWITGGGDGNYDEAAGLRADRALEQLQDEGMVRALLILSRHAHDAAASVEDGGEYLGGLDDDSKLSAADALRRLCEELEQRRASLDRQVQGRHRSGYYTDPRVRE